MSISFLEQLQSRFPSESITRTDFRKFIGIAASTDWRMQKKGAYPRTIRVGGHERILLTDLAAWLEQGGSVDVAPRKRGRPVGSKNKTGNAPLP